MDCLREKDQLENVQSTVYEGETNKSEHCWNRLYHLVEQVLIVWRNEEVKFELDLEVLVGHVTLGRHAMLVEEFFHGFCNANEIKVLKSWNVSRMLNTILAILKRTQFIIQYDV